ncbi:MAG: hypothetical protein J6N72_00825, partial [Psychrobacter sp.]|nr:hypothetical protein [Psychrobacter sp.]
MPANVLAKVNKIEDKMGFVKSKPSISLTADEIARICNCWQDNEATLFTGDNLVYLQALVAGEHGFVDVCYIDPPHNTGSKLLYDDNRKSKNISPFGTHVAWLQFMLPRLVMVHAL